MLIGTKYQTYVGDNLVVLRYIRTTNDINVFTDSKGVKVKLTEEEINRMVRLQPDAVMNLMITSNNNVKDVYACVHTAGQFSSSDSKEIPDLILRQDIYSYSKNFLNGTLIYVGDCLVKKTAPDPKTYKALMEFDNIIASDSVALYVDDTMNELKLLLDQKRFSKYNKTLKEIKSNSNNDNITGYCSDLIELMNSNNFIANYKSIFGIIQLDFPIKLDNNHTEDGVITLNSKQIDRLETHYIMKRIANVTVLSYDKDIDVSKLVKNTHIIVSDINGDIFLINYVVAGDLELEDVQDVTDAMTKLFDRVK